mmetsp:Transcript_150984/g.266426  ORF Transcript_150984/g.266426 Transcript_150984/m.266426 type:complete len:225 (-) Transcript_150984:163-837(-)
MLPHCRTQGALASGGPASIVRTCAVPTECCRCLSTSSLMERTGTSTLASTWSSSAVVLASCCSSIDASSPARSALAYRESTHRVSAMAQHVAFGGASAANTFARSNDHPMLLTKRESASSSSMATTCVASFVSMCPSCTVPCRSNSKMQARVRSCLGPVGDRSRLNIARSRARERGKIPSSSMAIAFGSFKLGAAANTVPSGLNIAGCPAAMPQSKSKQSSGKT